MHAKPMRGVGNEGGMADGVTLTHDLRDMITDPWPISNLLPLTATLQLLG
jgi:hypothetical protein